MIHKPVLLKEVIQGLNPQLGGVFIDATVNGGGHALAIAEIVGNKGFVLGIDWDKELVEKLNAELAERKNMRAVYGNYVDIENIARDNGIERADGILFDLGFSSYHIQSSNRGFSFSEDEPLDMRYDASEGITAAEVVNTYSKEKLFKIIREYGEERYAGRISDAIIRARRKHRIITTRQLVEAIQSALPEMRGHSHASARGYGRQGRIHFATRTFQALRIEVNGELGNIKRGLKAATGLLKAPSAGVSGSKGGRMAVISFHSLEDRIVKQYFKESAKRGLLEIIAKKPVMASQEEIMRNPASRSARLRIAQRL